MEEGQRTNKGFLMCFCCSYQLCDGTEWKADKDNQNPRAALITVPSLDIPIWWYLADRPMMTWETCGSIMWSNNNGGK